MIGGRGAFCAKSFWGGGFPAVGCLQSVGLGWLGIVDTWVLDGVELGDKGG